MNKGQFTHSISDKSSTVTHIMWQNGRAFCTTTMFKDNNNKTRDITLSNSMVISNLHVIPMYRGIGIGAELLDYVENEAKNKGCVTVAVWVDSKNKRLTDMYEHRGYLPSHHENGYYLMKKLVQ